LLPQQETQFRDLKGVHAVIKEVVCHPDAGFAEELRRKSGYVFFDVIAWSYVHVASPSMLLLKWPPALARRRSKSAGTTSISCAVSCVTR